MIEDPKPLVLAVVDALLVLELSGDAEIDPHVAVRAMEDISASLLRLGESDQREVRSMLSSIAAEWPDTPYGRFVATVADAVGLAT